MSMEAAHACEDADLRRLANQVDELIVVVIVAALVIAASLPPRIASIFAALWAFASFASFRKVSLNLSKTLGLSA